MTSVIQLRKDWCEGCAAQTLHDGMGCVHRRMCGGGTAGYARVDEVQRTVARDRLHALTARQRQVFYLMAAGLCAQQIAARLGIALTNVHVIRGAVALKLGVALRRRNPDNSMFAEFARRYGIPVHAVEGVA